MKRAVIYICVLLVGGCIGYYLRDSYLPSQPFASWLIGPGSGASVADFAMVNDELPGYLRDLSSDQLELYDVSAFVAPARNGDYLYCVYVSPLSKLRPDDVRGIVQSFVDRRFRELMDARAEPSSRDNRLPP